MTAITPFPSSASTCGVLGLLQSGSAFVQTVLTDAIAMQSSLNAAAASLLNLPNVVEGIVLGQVSALANTLTALAVGTIADFVTHLTSQFDNLVNNLSISINQAAAQAGLISAGCTLPAMGSIGTSGGGGNPCGNMQNMFGSIMGSGANLIGQITGTLNNLTSTVTGLIGGALTDISAALSTVTGLVSSISAVASNIANMVASEVAALAGALSDMITFGAASALFQLFGNPCAAQVLSAVGSPALLGFLSP